MPYEVRKHGNKWQTYNPESGKVYGTHDSEHAAKAQQALLYREAPPSAEEKKKRKK